MADHSLLDKDHFGEHPNVHRLSESRPMFKPVLVKELLADKSDDESDDEPVNDANSDEESGDDLDGLQPLSDDTAEMTAKALGAQTNVQMNIDVKEDEKVSAMVASQKPYEINTVKEVETAKRSSDSIKSSESNRQSIVSSYLSKKSEDDQPLTKRKNQTLEEGALQAHWSLKPLGSQERRQSLSVKERKEHSVSSKSYSTDLKRHSTSIASEVKEKSVSSLFTDLKESNRYSSTSVKAQSVKNEASSLFSDVKESSRYSSTSVKTQNIKTEEKDPVTSLSSVPQADQMSVPKTASQVTSQSSTAHPVMDTPMKLPQPTARPTPCNSHRNIFQTPQSKVGTDYAKSHLQTPATLFSHWSQQHMQTPMQSQGSREPILTPATSISQSQPRYYTEGKSVRRPLAETMFSAPTHGSHLPKVHEMSNESQPSPSLSKEAVTNENRNPNSLDLIKSESHGAPSKTVQESRSMMNSHADVKPKLEYHNNAYPSNPQPAKSMANYDKYPPRESQASSRPPGSSQAEQIPSIPCSMPQQMWNNNMRQSKMITVKNRQYVVLGTIGQGMSCEVVRAQDVATSELRAIKCVDLSKMDKESAKGCLQEICMLDKLKAPCIVHMYSFEINQPWVHVVMEIGDTDLSRLLKSMLSEKKKIPLTMILYYWTEMLTAVKHIHENGVIHSDLKPANFLLVRGRLKLIDFGIASSINSDMTSVVKNCTIGTLNYISPEALVDINAGSADSPNHNKFKISYKSDVWSLGCILYGLVYGVTPFMHLKNQWAKMNAITDPKHKITYPLVSGTEQVPLILIDVMNKCLQRDPKARPTVADLLDIPYLESNISKPVVPKIPSNILIKIKRALTDEEWKLFSETLENKPKPR